MTGTSMKNVLLCGLEREEIAGGCVSFPGEVVKLDRHITTGRGIPLSEMYFAAAMLWCTLVRQPSPLKPSPDQPVRIHLLGLWDPCSTIHRRLGDPGYPPGRNLPLLYKPLKAEAISSPSLVFQCSAQCLTHQRCYVRCC